MDEGRIRSPHAPERLLVPAPGLPVEFAAVLGSDARGRCLFLDEEGTCAIQRQADHRWLPSACRHFPRIALIDDRGVSVSLSHYCPTAARLLLRDDVELSIVERPPGFPDDGEYEGLDARGTLPPLVRPDALMDLESFDLWERHVVGVLAEPHRSPAAALAVLSACAEAIRAWRSEDGPLVDHVRAVLLREVADGPARPEPDREPIDRTVRRYLAARAFGSWVAYQGLGLRTSVRSLEAALAMVQAEAANAAAAAGRDLDEALLVEAIRRTDLQLIHLADREALAREWSGAEEERGGRL